MADIELVIKIPEEVYEMTVLKMNTSVVAKSCSEAEKIIANGTLLPKGHGELIDRSKLSICPIDITDLPQDKCLMVYLAGDVDNAEVIIAADKESEDANND